MRGSRTLTVPFIRWYFVHAPIREITRITRNFAKWAWQFFSIGYLAPRLLSPWHKDLTPYGRGFDPARFIKIFGWNLISRVIGAIMRLSVMILGLAVEALVISLGVLALAFWYLLPIVIPFLFVVGILMILS